MTETANNRINTIFAVVDKATRPLRSIGNASVNAANSIGKAMSAIGPLQAAIGGLVGGAALAGIKSLQGEYENLQIGMAQTVKFMGVGGETFAENLKAADEVIGQIEVAAAKLPGEAEDYAIAMKTAGTNVMRATGDYATTFKMVKDMTAIGVSMGRGATETAIQLNRMVDTTKGMMEMGSDFSVDLLNAMKNLPGQANLTTLAFNKMDVKGRVKLVQQLSGVYKDMIDQSGQTMDAIAGASSTIMKTLTRRATSPIFDAMKTSMSRVNDLLMDANGQTTQLADRFTTIAAMAGETASSMLGLSDSRAPDLALPGGTAAMGGAAAVGLGVAGGVGATALGPMALLVGGLTEFGTRTEDVTAVIDHLQNTATMLMTPLGSMAEAFEGASVLIADVFSGTLEGLISGFNKLLEPVLFAGDMMFSIANEIFTAVQPSLAALWKVVGTLFDAIGTFLNPIIRVLGFILYGLWNVVKVGVVPIFTAIVDVVTAVIGAFGDLLNWIGKWTGKAVDSFDPRAKTKGGAKRSFWDDFMANIDKKAAAAKADREKGGLKTGGRTAPKTRSGDGRVTQDFRYSRFALDQKFAEGMDPDRIAVAFTKQVGSLGTQKLQSGLEPSFSVGGM